MKALITGASSGIGRDIARALAARGVELVLVARREDRLAELARSLPVPVTVIPLDLSREENCFRLYRQLRGTSIDILVNNAGFGLFGAFHETDLRRELEMIDVNIRAVHILTKLFLREFRRRDSGYILNVSSAAAFLPGPLMAAYYATKAYVLRLTEAIHEELRREGSQVKIAALCPGPVHTEFDRVADVRFSVRGLDSRRVAEYAADRLLRGRLVIVPGPLMKITRQAVRLLPEGLLLRASYHMQKRKKGQAPQA